MQHVDPSLFSNVVAAVQRTSSLPGGAVRGLPGGMVIEGLQGVSAFGSDIAEAKKELELGRVHAALARVRQVEAQFNGMAGRWSGNVGSIISSTRQGNQKLPLQKLNEAKNAQAKMQQLIGPATKAFRDLTSALDQAVASMAHTEKQEDESELAREATDGPARDAAPPLIASDSEKPDNEKQDDDMPDIDSLGNYVTNYQFGPKLGLRRSLDSKTRVEPKILEGKFYFLSGFDPPRVVRIREVQRKAVLVFDADRSREIMIDANELKQLLASGIWILEPKKIR